MKKNRKLIIGAVVLVAVIAILAIVYSNFKPKTTTGSKSYTLEVVDADGNTTSYEGSTDAEYLSQVMDELVETGNFTYEGDASDFGLYITTINGIVADYDTDGAYWSIYVNDEYGQYGADTQPVTDGDDYKFVYEVFAE